MQMTVVPLGTGSASLGESVAEVVKVVRRKGLKHELNAMGTNVEGPVEQLFAVAREMHEAGFHKGTPRVTTVITIDDRRDKELTMEYRVQSVLARLKQ